MAIYTTYDDRDQYSRYVRPQEPPTDIHPDANRPYYNAPGEEAFGPHYTTDPIGIADHRPLGHHGEPTYQYRTDAEMGRKRDSDQRIGLNSGIGNIQTAPGTQGAGSSTTPTVNQTGPPPTTITDYAHSQAPDSTGTPGPADPNISPVTGMPRSAMSMRRAEDHDRFMGDLGNYLSGAGPFPRMGPRPEMPGREPAPPAFPNGPMPTDPATGLPVRDGLSSPFPARSMNAAGATPPPPTSIAQEEAPDDVQVLEDQYMASQRSGDTEEQSRILESIRALDPDRAARLESYVSSRKRKSTKNAPKKPATTDDDDE